MDYRTKLLEDPEFKIEALKAEFIMDVTEEICEKMFNDNVTRLKLAEKLDKSKSFVSQVLNGTRNMTLGTLAEIAHFMGYKPHIEFRHELESATINISKASFKADKTNFNLPEPFFIQVKIR